MPHGTKAAVYKVPANRVYLGEAVHKGVSYPGEHVAIIDERIWEKAHAVMAEPARKRGAATRAEVPEGPDLRAERPADVAEPHPPARSDLSLLRRP